MPNQEYANNHSFSHSRHYDSQIYPCTYLHTHTHTHTRPYSCSYKEFERAVGADPASNITLKCDLRNATWMGALFDQVTHDA